VVKTLAEKTAHYPNENGPITKFG